jgi:hypothetical protein
LLLNAVLVARKARVKDDHRSPRRIGPELSPRSTAELA